MYSAVKCLLLILCVGLSQCQEDKCPAPIDVFPCDCFTDYGIVFGVKVICNGKENRISIEALQKSLKSLHGKKIEHLNMYLVNLEHASSDLLNNLVIQEAYIHGTNITEMPAFKGSENTLQTLTLFDAISEKTIQSFTLNMSHLNKLKSFTFRYSNLHSKDRYNNSIAFGNDWFENGPSSLEVVNLNSNWAKSFGDRSFSNLVNLKEIDLRQNRIEEVHRSMFPDPGRKLMEIYLSYNKLKSLPEDIFSNMPVLNRVDVSDNSITVLNERTWRPVWEQLFILKLGSDLICDSKIYWTFNMKRPKELEGKCEVWESNLEYKGKSLKAIIDLKQNNL